MDKIVSRIYEFSINHTVENATEIFNQIQMHDRNSMQNLHNFALASLINHISEYNGRNEDEIKTMFINSVRLIIESSKIKELNQLRITILVLIKTVYDLKKGEIKPNMSEELKLSFLECLTIVLKNASSDIIADLYDKDNKKLLPRVCFVCSHCIEHETYRKIKIRGIECLMAAFQVHDQSDFSDIVLREQVAENLFFILPKTMASLLSVIHGDAKQGAELFTISIKALGRILCLIMEDYQKLDSQSTFNAEDFKALLDTTVKFESNSDVLASVKNLSTKDKLQYYEELKRTPEWLNAASGKLIKLIQGLDKFVANENQQIQFELAKMLSTLIEKCSKYMEPCLPVLYEITIGLSQNNDSNISELCKSTLRKSMTNFDIVENILHSHLIKMPRILITGSVDEQISALRLFKGILHMFADTKLNLIFSNHELLDKLSGILLAAVELERSTDLLHEEYSIRQVDQYDEYGKVPWKSFKYLTTKQLEIEISDICLLIGQSNATNIFSNYLLDLFRATDRNCNEVIILLQLTIPHCKDKELIRLCLDELLDENHWDLAIQSNQNTVLEKNESENSYWHEERTEGLYESAVSIRYTDVRWSENEQFNSLTDDIITINDAKFNVLHMCLVLETIGKLALSLESQFQPFLLKSLHRILEKTGSSNYALHIAGSYALNAIRKTMNYEAVSELIHKNSDYIAFFVNISLKKPEEYKKALDILSVILNYSSLDSILYLDNIIQTILDESIKHHQTKQFSSFLKVFELILRGILTWTSDEKDIENNVTDADIEKNRLDEEKILCENWINILVSDENSEKSNETHNSEEIYVEDENNPDSNNEELSETKPDLPKHIEIAKNILQQILKYISSKNRAEKLIALDTIGIGLNILKSYENELLPIVHLIWYPFVERLSDKDPVILRRCFDLLIVLGDVAKDFITSRTSKEVFPHLIKFLQNLSEECLHKNHDKSIEKTLQFKFVYEIIIGLPRLLIDLEISERDLNKFFDALKSFLHKNQPKQLQQGSVTFFIDMYEFDGPAVVVKLKDSVHLNFYKENVSEILSKLL